VARAKELGVKVTNPKARVTTEVWAAGLLFGHFAWGMGLLNIMSEGGAKMYHMLHDQWRFQAICCARRAHNWYLVYDLSLLGSGFLRAPTKTRFTNSRNDSDIQSALLWNMKNRGMSRFMSIMDSNPTSLNLHHIISVIARSLESFRYRPHVLNWQAL
jgi:hypothetical protein